MKSLCHRKTKPIATSVKQNAQSVKLSIILPGASVQYVFPSPMYPWLQEQLNEPNMFLQEARLGRQSWTPSSHSSISVVKMTIK